MDELDGLQVPGAQRLDYSAYLRVQSLLELQEPRAEPREHDEMLFIIIHQVYELWLKQILHEIDGGALHLEAKRPMAFLRTLERIQSILEVLVNQVRILETMTPTDFNRFREVLNPASGFQSLQFRLVEFRLGKKDDRYLKFFAHNPEAVATLVAAAQSPSLYDIFLDYLEGWRTRPFDRAERLARNRGSPDPQAGITSDLLQIYRHPEEAYDLYMVCEALIGIDEGFYLWRQRHVAMVERMIGGRGGTGGSSGAAYLRRTTDHRFFPELWDVRNHLGATAGVVGYGQRTVENVRPKAG